MIPVDSPGQDTVVPATGQLAATVLTGAVALAAVLATLALCRRQRLGWPLLVLVSGLLTALLEPLFDHLYGLWFATRGQWNAVVTYGIHIPVWLPVIYIAYYGAWTVYLVRRFGRDTGGISMADIGKLYLASVGLAALAEEAYINGFGLYGYQDHQPFVLYHYPVFVAFVNGVPPFLAAIGYHRLLPLLRGWARLAILGVVPVCFAADSFGSGFLYLAARHATPTPSMFVLSLLALLTVASCVGLIWCAAKLAGLDRVPARSAAAVP